MHTPYRPRLHRYALATTAATLLLLVAGGLVTSNDAGLSVPDWPLSYGSLFPPMVGGIVYEHSHRMIAALVGLMTIGLVVWLARVEPRTWVRYLAYAALALVVLQGILGGLTVLFYLPRPISIAHATMAQIFFTTVATLALFTSQWWLTAATRPSTEASRRAVRFARWTALTILAQLILGAAYRHGGLGITPHLLGAGAVLVATSWTSRLVRRANLAVALVTRLRILLASLVGTQILLGFGAWWAVVRSQQALQPMPEMVWLTVAHLACGALTLATATLLWLAMHRVTMSSNPAGRRATIVPPALQEGGRR
jgi:cytochrome c oxidase assembly protein subunit 15